MSGTMRKQSRSPREAAFEATGLRALHEAGARVPQVLEVGATDLVLERIEVGAAPTTEQEEAFGRELAALHRTTGARYGAVDGDPAAYLGRCPIDLTPCDTFAESYLQRRAWPLARQAVDAGALDPAALPLLGRLGQQDLGPVEPPTLVHGDLWAGNRLVDRQGRSWLIDPSAQHGHREQDLAMMQLFGGFSSRVFDAYAEAFPPADGWRDRVGAYQLVPLLVHAILFGGGYGDDVLRVLRAHGSAPGR